MLAAAEELAYVADPYASRLAAGRTRTIGMVVPQFAQWFFTQVGSGAEAVLAAAGYDVLLYNVGGPEGRKRFFASLPFRKRVDGLIVIDLPVDEREQDLLAGNGIPIAGVGITTDLFPSVVIDNVAAARTATRHLVNLGHERIALISGFDDDPLRFTAPLERRRGYREVMQASGLEVRPELDVPGNFSMVGGAEAMAQLLATDRPPTAVFAESDEMAFGALKTLHDSGMRVPADVSLVGFDDHDVAEFVGLTTISQPVVLQGEIAAGLLLDAMGDAPPSLHRQQVTIPTKLVVRATTGPRRDAQDGATSDGTHA